MKQDFLSEFTGNPNLARILRALVFNENEQFSAKRASKMAAITPLAAEAEMKSLEKMGIAKRGRSTARPAQGTEKKQESEVVWSLNPTFKHLRPLSAFVREISPMRYEEIVDALKGSGRLSTLVLSGSFMGDPSRPADILLAADGLNEIRLEGAVKDLEPMFGRELRYAAFSVPEFRYRMTVQDRLIRDTLDFPHLVLLDRSHLL